MNLSKQGNMFTETFLDKNFGEIEEKSYVIDLDFSIGKLSVSPVPHESCCVRADESSVSMVTPDASGADLLLSAFDSISFTGLTEQRDDVGKDTIKTDAYDCTGEVDLPGQTPDDGKYSNKFDSSDSAGIAEPSTERDGKAEVVVESDQTRKPNHPLIVYTSSRRSACNTKSSQNEPRRPPRNCKRTTNKKTVLELNSLQISRRRRSLFPTRVRSSVWGFMGNILPDSEEHSGLDLNLTNGKKLRRASGGRGIRNAISDQTGRKSIGKTCTPTGHISLKIKIGNQSCGLGNVTENFNAPESQLEKEVSIDMVLPLARNLENVMSSNASVLSTNFDVRGTVEKPCFSTSSDHQQIISQEEGHNLEASIDNRSTDPETSPDSEVINSVPDFPLVGKALPNMQSSPSMSNACVSVGDVSCLNLLQKKFKKGKKKHNLHQAGKCSAENNTTGSEITNNAKVPAELGLGQKVGNVSYYNDASIITTAKPYLNTYCSNGVSRVPLRCSRVTDSGTSPATSKVHSGAETNPSSGLVTAIESSNSRACDELAPCSNGHKFLKFSIANGGSKSRSGIFDLPSKKDKVSKKKRNQNKSGGMHKVNEKGDASCILNGVEIYLEAGNQMSTDLGETGALSQGSSGPIKGLHFSDGGIRDQYFPLRNAWVLCDECQQWRRIPATLADQIEETNCGWTCKDNTDKDFADCSISQEKSNAEINEELEISDASCEEDTCDASLTSNQNRSKVFQQSSWSLIKSNLFLHRNRKTQTIDEVMVCHCKPPSDGRMGCGAKCLNRMLNIECVRGTCPCGELCSNQQFQRRKYTKLKWFRCGKKGHGLQALEDTSEGQFLIEYVGEVLDVRAYEARQREYALNGHKHFYFMTLNGSEVIDACAKGNLGRFINHSCDPNCRTEKWMVNGEVCVGLFAVRDIKKGEEVTFDYNYVRVFGAAVKKCVCGSPNCRGYIGGDPSNFEVIVQGDSDDESSEPLMICEDREMTDDWNDIMSNSLSARENEIVNDPPKNRYRMSKLEYAVGHSESIAETHTSETLTQKVEGVISASPNRCLKTSVAAQTVKTVVRHKLKVGKDSASNAVGRLDMNKETGESLNRSASAASKVESEGVLSQMHSSVQRMNIYLQSDGTMNKGMFSDQNEYSLAQKTVANSFCSAHGSEMNTSALPSKSRPDTLKSKSKLKYATMGGRKELIKSNVLAKTHHSSNSIKKAKVKSNVVSEKGTPDVDKSNAAPHKSDNLPEHSLNDHFEAVEEKLNELLDPEGGISKRKDASRGYLKLLFLTAASGNNGHGEAIQSNRDLSMILDALLKTKSRTVLVDIINKNGLQMLHNIMKRYRKEFIKTPILRKLLKVLEYLATREILTLEHITGGPPCPGVESFKDSILTLTEHDDKQVHQIARNFRDRWIPRSLRKSCCMERYDGRMEFPQRSSYSRFSLSHDHWSDRVGKPSEAIDCCEVQSVATSGAVEISTLDHISTSGSYGTNGTKTRKRKSRWDNPAEDHLHPRIRTNLEGDGNLNIDVDIPPGFSSPCNGPMLPSDASAIAINLQERDVCIKHPFEIELGDSQQRFIACMSVSYGIPFSIMQQFGVHAETSEGWTIAPGVPFHPFPPLPPYALNNGDRPTSIGKCAPLSEPEEKVEQSSDKFVARHSGQKHARTSDMDPPEMNVLGANDQPDFQQAGNSFSLGRKYFRQQKWNHSKLTPPWVRMRNVW